MKGTVTLILIVKDEEKNIQRCLESVKGQVDEIVIVDTGSTDRTMEIAACYTNKLYHYCWNGDFSDARNFALSKANCEWILSLDADEELLDKENDLQRLITDKNIDAYLLPLYNPTSEINGEYNIFQVLRLFRNNGRYRFQGKIHEQIIITDEEKVGIAEKPILKHKMLSSNERNKKRGRNLALLKKAVMLDPKNSFLQYYIGVEWLMLGKPGKAYSFLKQSYSSLTDEHIIFRGPGLRYLILCLQALGRLDEAICYCLEADLRYPEYTDIYYLCGVLLEEKKEYLLAKKWLKQAVQCGLPPALYSHMNGTESFLAYYHLGYCSEMLGQKGEAFTYYEMALRSNPKYIYPLHSLFLLLYVTYGPEYTLDYLREQEIIKDKDSAKAAANLFFLSNYPALAFKCFEEFQGAEMDEELLLYRAKYAIFSGRIQQGVRFLDHVPENKELKAEAYFYRALAYSLLGKFEEAKTAAYSLWKKVQWRSMGYALLSLIKFMDKGTSIICSGKICDENISDSLFKVYDICTHYFSYESCDADSLYLKMRTCLEVLIKDSSAKGYMLLIENMKHKNEDAKNFFTYKFGFERD